MVESYIDENSIFENHLSYWKQLFSDTLPSDFEKKTMETLGSQEWEMVLKAYDDEYDDFGLLLMGPSGLGKTHALMALLNQILQNCFKHYVPFSKNVAYYPVGYLIYRLRTFKGAENKIFDNCAKTRFLFLDDLGTENTTDFAREHFFTILDIRCQKKLPTFITTNLTMSELKEKYGERLVSRLKEMCAPLQITGSDRRTGFMKDRILELKQRATRLPYKDDESLE